MKFKIATCGCKSCTQWQSNLDVTSHACLSFGFVIRILKNILKYESDYLSSIQKESIDTVIDTVEKLDVKFRELIKESHD